MNEEELKDQLGITKSKKPSFLKDFTLRTLSSLGSWSTTFVLCAGFATLGILSISSIADSKLSIVLESQTITTTIGITPKGRVIGILMIVLAFVGFLNYEIREVLNWWKDRKEKVNGFTKSDEDFQIMLKDFKTNHGIK